MIAEALLVLVAALGTGVVLSRDPRASALVFSVYGVALALLFLALQAPDVALSQLVVGSAAEPILLLLALARMRRDLQ